VTAIEGLKILRKSSHLLMKDIKDNAMLFRRLVKQSGPKVLINEGPEESPLFHISLSKRMNDRIHEERVLQEIVDLVININSIYRLQKTGFF
jgi:hypothetical protein